VRRAPAATSGRTSLESSPGKIVEDAILAGQQELPRPIRAGILAMVKAAADT